PGTTSLGPFHPQRPGDWWTGEDSNLRSPQGAADLQSAGFSHSPTRPAKNFWNVNYEVRTCPSTTCSHSAQKHKKDSCQKTPARSFFRSGFAPPSLPHKIAGGAGGGN